MNILLSGSNGFLGMHLMQKLKDTNLSLLNRSRCKNTSSFPYFQYAMNELENYSPALKNCEVVIHCAALINKKNNVCSHNEYRNVNTLGTLNLAQQAANAGVKRFIFISSIKVNGESTQLGKPFDVFDKPSPKDHYGQSKAEAEEKLLTLAKETGLEVVIIRPTLVYGPEVKANFASLLKLVARGFPIPFGAITKNRRSLVSIDNLVDLIITCIDHPKAANQIFLVSDDHDVSTSELIKEVSNALGKSCIQLPVPIWSLNFLAKIFNKSDQLNKLIGSLQVDISHTKEMLNWTPPQSLQLGLKKTANAFLQTKK